MALTKCPWWNSWTSSKTQILNSFSSLSDIYLNTLVHSSPHLPLYSKEEAGSKYKEKRKVAGKTYTV
jgi:hypothetical protein